MIAVYILSSILLCIAAIFVVTCQWFKKGPYNNGQKRDVMIVLGYPAKKMEVYHQSYESE